MNDKVNLFNELIINLYDRTVPLTDATPRTINISYSSFGPEIKWAIIENYIVFRAWRDGDGYRYNPSICP